MTDDGEPKQRWDIGLSLPKTAWLAIIAAALALVFALGFGIKHFFESKGPAALYEKQLHLDEE